MPAAKARSRKDKFGETDLDKRKVLFVSHNHPAIRPGGAEAYAHELHRASAASDGRYQPIFLARSGPPVSNVSRYHEGTLVTTVDGKPDEYFFYTDVSDYDWFYGRGPNKVTLTRYFRDFLLAHQPDIVHFQHTLFLGYDAIRVTRNTLPQAPIVYTLHEFLPICHRNGQMVRTKTEDLCTHASPRRCHECFPAMTPQTFLMRELFIKSQLGLVDLFLAPSRFLLERFVAWGIPPEKIRFEDYGRVPIARRPEVRRGAHNRFAFFGQLSFFKGVNVLLRAMEILGDAFEGHLWIYGGNLDLQPKPFIDEFERLLDSSKLTVTFAGQYDHSRLGSIMQEIDWVIVPSIWWENSPLVIQEAFLYGRPVICSDIGGMAEKVEDGRSGLHFRRSDPHDLARVMQRAAAEPGLWESLSEGVPTIYSMQEHNESLTRLYDELLTGGRPREGDLTQKVEAAPEESLT